MSLQGKDGADKKLLLTNIFTYNVALNIMHENEDLKSRTIE